MYAALGDLRQAASYFEQQLALARSIGDRQSEGKALGNLGNVLDDLDETDTALSYYEQRLELAKSLGDNQVWL